MEKNGYNRFENMFKLHSTKGLSLNNMHLYDENGVIQQFNHVHEIIHRYYNVRYDRYEKRKAHLLNKLEKELIVLNAKVRFITELINKDISMFNVKKVVVEETLCAREYPKHNDSYDYLIRMPIYSLTEEKKDDLIKEAENKQVEYMTLKEKTPGMLWTEDLDVFERAYDEFMVAREQYDNEECNGENNGAKKKGKRTKK